MSQEASPEEPKFDGKRKTVEKYKTASQKKERLTSSKEGVEVLPATTSCLSPAPIFAFFGEGARGLVVGVDVST
jgi:hypothetical protein